ncbi:hypothetical protein F4818DRAFT_446889 [Hypoxylon cercidicola]|nr:hypothetical protein F4818DRAFT_446889 [Hypoxylon cercidicola]
MNLMDINPGCPMDAELVTEKANTSLGMLHDHAQDPDLDESLLITSYLASMIEKLDESKSELFRLKEHVARANEEIRDRSLETIDQNAGRETTICDSSSKKGTVGDGETSHKTQDAIVSNVQVETTESKTISLPEDRSLHAPEPLEIRSIKTVTPVLVPPRHSGTDHLKVNKKTENKIKNKTRSKQEVEEETAAETSRKCEKAAKAKERRDKKKKRAAEKWQKKKSAERAKNDVKEKRRIQQEEAERKKILSRRSNDAPQRAYRGAKEEVIGRPLLKQELEQMNENQKGKEVENRLHSKDRGNGQPMQPAAPCKGHDEDKSKLQRSEKKVMTTEVKIAKHKEAVGDVKHPQERQPSKPDVQSQSEPLESKPSKPRPKPQSNSRFDAWLRDHNIQPFQPRPGLQGQAVRPPSPSKIPPARPQPTYQAKPPSPPQIVPQLEHQAQSLPVSRPEDPAISHQPPESPPQVVSPWPPSPERDICKLYQNLKNDYRLLRDHFESLQCNYRALQDNYRSLSTQNHYLHDQNNYLHDQNKNLYTHNTSLSAQERDSLQQIHQLHFHDLESQHEYDTLYGKYQRLLFNYQQRQQAEMQGLSSINDGLVGMGRNLRPQNVASLVNLPEYHTSTDRPTQSTSNLGSQMKGVKLNAEAPAQWPASTSRPLKTSAPLQRQDVERPRPRPQQTPSHHAYRNQRSTRQSNARARQSWKIEEDPTIGSYGDEKEEDDENLRQWYVFGLPRGDRKVSI